LPEKNAKRKMESTKFATKLTTKINTIDPADNPGEGVIRRRIIRWRESS
jgi:hypothetical protein